MKLSQISKVESILFEPWHVMESLNSVLSDLKWTTYNSGAIGIGYIDDLKIQVKIDSIVYEDAKGLNLTFGIFYKDDTPEENFQNTDMKQVSKIFGGVSNAIKDKIKEYDWDFLSIVAKDHVEKRARLYKHIADRLANQFRLYVVQSKVKNTNVILMCKKQSGVVSSWDKFLKDNG